MQRNIIVSVACLLLILHVGATTVSAQGKWVDSFLRRYRPTAVTFPPGPGVSQQELADMIRSGQLPLTVNDMINLLLSNNLDVGLNRLSPLSSEYILSSLYRTFEPTLRLGATVGRSTTPSTNQFSSESNNQLSHGYSVGFGQTLQTGTRIAVDFSMNRLSTNSPFATFDPSWTDNIRYSFVQPLMRDRGRLINTRQIRIAKNNQELSEIQFEENVINLVVQAQKTYWDLVFAAEDIKVKQRSVDLAQKTLSDNQIQVNVGTMAPIDLIQAQSEVASRKEALVVSTYTQTQNEDQVKKLITSQADPGMVLARLAPMQAARRPVAGDVPGIEEAIRIALENRPEMRQLELELKNKDIDVEYTRNQLLPAVDLSASYTQNGLGGVRNVRAGFGAPVTDKIPGGQWDAMKQLFGYDYTGYQIGINVQIPLRNRAAQADNARAVTDKRIVENRLTSTAQQIALEVRNAVTQVDMNRARIEAAQTARELAERRLESEQKKYDLGASTIRFVLEEQRNVAQAQTNEIAALVNYTKALVDFDRATGMSLKKNNIQIEKTLGLPGAAK
jgi:outer membrane protein TolC